jgi:hypothetical protein
MQLLKNFPTFYGTQRVITVFTRTLHWSLYRARSFQSIPLVLHVLPISFSLTLSFSLYLAKSTSYEANYAVFSNLLSLYPSSVQIFSSAPFSQTPSVYVPSFTRIQNHMQNCSFVYSDFYFFRQQTGRRKEILD